MFLRVSSRSNIEGSGWAGNCSITSRCGRIVLCSTLCQTTQFIVHATCCHAMLSDPLPFHAILYPSETRKPCFDRFARTGCTGNWCTRTCCMCSVAVLMCTTLCKHMNVRTCKCTDCAGMLVQSTSCATEKTAIFANAGSAKRFSALLNATVPFAPRRVARRGGAPPDIARVDGAERARWPTDKTHGEALV